MKHLLRISSAPGTILGAVIQETVSWPSCWVCFCCLVAKLCPTLCDSIDWSLPGSSVHGILQARILEWVAISFFRGCSQLRDRTCISCTDRHILYHWGTGEPCWVCDAPPPTPQFSSVQFSCSVVSDSLRPHESQHPGLPVHHQLPEFTQTHVHWVSDAIQPSHPLSSPSPPAPNPSQHQSLFQWVNSSHEVAKVLEFRL